MRIPSWRGKPLSVIIAVSITRFTNYSITFHPICHYCVLQAHKEEITPERLAGKILWSIVVSYLNAFTGTSLLPNIYCWEVQSSVLHTHWIYCWQHKQQKSIQIVKYRESTWTETRRWKTPTRSPLKAILKAFRYFQNWTDSHGSCLADKGDMKCFSSNYKTTNVCVTLRRIYNRPTTSNLTIYCNAVQSRDKYTKSVKVQMTTNVFVTLRRIYNINNWITIYSNVVQCKRVLPRQVNNATRPKHIEIIKHFGLCSFMDRDKSALSKIG